MASDRTFNQSDNYYYAKYGNEEYSLSIAMYNNEGYVMYLQRNDIIHLVIEDNVFNAFHSGHLILNNDQGIIEKSAVPYVFLGNGRDILKVAILPMVTGNTSKDYNDEQNKDNLGLSFEFVIVESEDIVYNNVICKKISFVEYAQYMLSENICNIFSLQKAGNVVPNYMGSNSGNSTSTGDAIKQVLKSVYETDDFIYVDDKGRQIFESDSESSISLSPYGVVSYMEVLNYILTYHSYNKSPCILKFDRFQNKFILISLKTLFEKNVDYVIETIKFPAISKDESNRDAPEYPAVRWEIFPVSFEESKIMQFYINSPTTKYNVDLAGNSGITSSSRAFKSMVFNLTTLNSDSFMKEFYNLFVKPFKDVKFKTEQNSLEIFPNFYPNPNKKNNFKSHSGVLPPEMEEKKFLNQKLATLLYLNNVYQFKLMGKTHRRSLSFLDVIKTAEIKDGRYVATKWDLNNLGRHFITSVKHIFTFDKYMNEIETIKPYRLVDGTDNGVTLEEFLAKEV
jgi:hypothetical protein